MFTRTKNTWESLPRWVRGTLKVIAILLVVYAVFFLAIYVIGSGKWHEAQAATTPQPSKAWVLKGKIARVEDAIGSVGVISQNHRVTCMEAQHEKRYVNVWGSTLIWLKMTKEWCYSKRRHEVTSQPAARVTAGVTTLGSIGQWTIEKVENQPTTFYPYEGWEKGGSRSRAVLMASRCFPVKLLGCVHIGSTTETVEILGHSDGTFSRY